MTNGAKILITIAIIITLSIVTYGKLKNRSQNEKTNSSKSEYSDIMQYFNEETKQENNEIENREREDNKIESNKIENNEIENNTILNNI